MKRIATVRDLRGQQSFMWSERLVDEEVAVCGERSILSPLLRLLPPDEPILEAGCGLGAWVVFLHRKGYRITGIDHDEAVIRRLRAWAPLLDVSRGTIGALGFPDSSFGAYISLGVLEHFEEGADGPLHEAYRILKPGGVLFMTVPYNNLFRKVIAHPLRLLYLAVHRLRGGSTHFAEYRYVPSELRRMVEQAGFRVLDEGLDDFISPGRSLSLWSEFPFLRGSGPYALNAAGRLLALLLNSISPALLASGIFIAAVKPE